MLVVGQLDERVDVPREVGADVPFEILGTDRGAAEENLDTFVTDQAGVHLAICITGLRQHVGVDDVVLGVLQVEVDVAAEAVVEHLELGTHLIGSGDGRLDVLVHLRGRLIERRLAVQLGVDGVGRQHTVGADGGTHLGHGTTDLPEVQPRSIDEFAQHEGEGSTTVEVAVVGGRKAGVKVVTDGTVEVDQVVPADGRRTEERTGLVVGLTVVGRIGAAGSGQVEVAVHGKTTVGAAVQIPVVIFTRLCEGGGLDAETVVCELSAPGQVRLGRHIVRLVLIGAEIRVKVDGTGAVLLLILLERHGIVDADTETEVERQRCVDITRDHVVLRRVGVVVVVHHGIRVVVEVGGNVVRGNDIPGTPAAVRTEVILVLGDIHVGVAPLREVADEVTVGRVAFLLGVLVLAIAVAVAHVRFQPGSRLQLRGHAERTADSLGVVEDTRAVDVGERNAGAHALRRLGERHVGGVVPGHAGQVAQVQAIRPGLCLTVVRGRRIPGKSGPDQGPVVVTRAPVHVLTIVVVEGAVTDGLQDRRCIVRVRNAAVVQVRCTIRHTTTTIETLEVEVLVVGFGGSRV